MLCSFLINCLKTQGQRIRRRLPLIDLDGCSQDFSGCSLFVHTTTKQTYLADQYSYTSLRVHPLKTQTSGANASTTSSSATMKSRKGGQLSLFRQEVKVRRCLASSNPIFLIQFQSEILPTSITLHFKTPGHHRAHVLPSIASNMNSHSNANNHGPSTAKVYPSTSPLELTGVLRLDHYSATRQRSSKLRKLRGTA